jgi:pimeloyl-ACP methyl ester carboxylesterase
LDGHNDFVSQKPTLVMVHGAGGRSQVWLSQIHDLNDAVNTIALDLPGHGDTPGPGSDSIAEYVRWLSGVLQKLFREPVFLMGHSMGGAIVQETALQHPDLVEGIILAATGARLEVAPLFLEGLLSDFDATIEKIIHYSYSRNADQLLLREGARLMKEPGSAVVHGDFAACDFFDRRNDLNQLAIPCLIVCGDQDKLTPRKLSEDLNHSIAGSRLRIIPAAGHMLMIEAPAAFNEHVRDFILSF